MNIFKYYFGLICILIISSCSSPESDGERLAKQTCENTDSYIANIVKAYNNFIKDFSDQGYNSRIEAREALNKKLDEIRNDFNKKNNVIDEKFSQLLAKYEDDYKKTTELILARKKVLDTYSADSTMFRTLYTQASNKILTIIPREPDKSKLIEDLIGRKIYALPGGYFSDSWVWIIENGEIKDLLINEVKTIDPNNKEYNISMTLQGSGAAYQTKVKVFYKLEERDDWEIDVLEPSEVNIVKTGRYDNSITVNVSTYIMGKYFNIRNNSDAALLVGYQILDFYGGWKKYSKIVSGGNSSSQLMLGLEDYKIDFVERP